MAGGGGNDGGMISGINVTPLVDITLVLLIIFMVTAKILTAPALPLDLPKAVKSEEVQVIFSISVPVHGPLQINGKAVTGDQPFMKLAREALAKDPELRAVVQADGAVPHRQVVHVMDLLRRAGITHIAIGALPEEPEKT